MNELELQTRLAENLKRIRKDKKMTQFELAEKADISEMTVKKVETCKQWPSEKTLVQIANALEIDVYNLFLPVPLNLKIEGEVKEKIENALMEGFKLFVKNATENAVCKF